MSSFGLIAALLLGTDSLPPQNQPVNITEVSGTPVSGSVPVTCISGCGGGVTAPTWDAGVIVQYPVAIASLWDGGVVVENQVQVYTWDSGVEVENFPASFGASQTGNWAMLMLYDGGAIPVTVTNQVAIGSLWDGGVLVQNLPAVFPSTQSGNWAMLMLYDGGPIPIATWDSGVEVENFPAVQAVSQNGTWTVQQGTPPWSVAQSGSWFIYTDTFVDGGNIAVTAIPFVYADVFIDGGIVQAIQSGNWAVQCVSDGGSFLAGQAATSTITQVASSASSVSLLAANGARKGFSVFNDSSKTLYLAEASTSSTTLYTVQVFPRTLYECPVPVYTGAISGIWASVNGNAYVTERQ